MLGLACLGAGCSTKTFPWKESTSSSSLPKEAQAQRVYVPELGISYAPSTTDTSIGGEVVTSGTRLFFGDTSGGLQVSNFIERIPKTETESIETALQAFMKKTGGSPSRCQITISTSTADVWDWLPGGWKTATFIPKKIYKPTAAEIRHYLRSTSYPKATNQQLDRACTMTPECGWAEEELIQKRNEEACGSYTISPHYQRVSLFIVDPTHPATMLYVHTTGGGDRPVFDGGLIQIER